MATTYEGQGQGQGQGQHHQQPQQQQPQPVVVHVHVHMHQDDKPKEKQQQQQPAICDHSHGYHHYETCQRAPPSFYETPQRSFQYARTLGLPQPRPMYPQNQLPRLVFSGSVPDPLPVYTSQTPRLVQQDYSPRSTISRSSTTDLSQDLGSGGDAQVRYVYKEARPIEYATPPGSLSHRYIANRNRTVQDLARNQHDNRQIEQRAIEASNNQSRSDDVGPIFRPGYSEKYVRNVRRETVVKPGVRLPNTVSVNTHETSTNQQDDVDRTVYKPLKDVFTDTQDAPVSFELKKPRFPYNFSKTGGLSGSRSMTSLDGKTHDKHVVFENAKYRPVFKDEATGKTFRIHSMGPIQEEHQRTNANSSNVMRQRFYDDSYNPMYLDNPAMPKNKRNSMPAGMSNFRLDSSSPAHNLTRETEEAEQLQSILKNAR